VAVLKKWQLPFEKFEIGKAQELKNLDKNRRYSPLVLLGNMAAQG